MVVPYEKASFKDDEVIVDDVSVTYIQNNDCTETESIVQTITLSTRNNGVSRFINIKTDNWSISDVNDIVELISDFKNRAIFL